MDMNSYQQKALTTFLLDTKDEKAVWYTALGLVGEAGEVANKLKKVIRGDYSIEKIKEDVLDELGDVLWYVSVLSECLDGELNKVAHANIRKLQNRKKKGLIQGSGDKRGELDLYGFVKGLLQEVAKDRSDNVTKIINEKDNRVELSYIGMKQSFFIAVSKNALAMSMDNPNNLSFSLELTEEQSEEISQLLKRIGGKKNE